MNSKGEDVNTLRFGRPFDDTNKVTPLTNAEALEILEELDESIKARGYEPSEAIQNSKSYASMVSYNVKRSVMDELRGTIQRLEQSKNLRRPLHPYEVTSLLNLAPEDYEQAVSLIPSLLYFDTADEKQLIEEVVKEIRDKTGLGA